jgi:DNA-binding transcriptional regulator LsrR (DeoR family)
MARVRIGQRDDRTGPVSSLLGARVARMHFIERMSNLEIADALNISRFRVARLIDAALDNGWITIQIATPASVDPDLSQLARDRWGLVDALVLSANPNDPPDVVQAQRGTSRLAARFLQDYLTEGRLLGVSWGTTVDGVAAELEAMPRFPRCDVVQLAGNLPTAQGTENAGDVLRRFAAVLGGASFPLHAPLVVPDASVAAGIRREQSVAQTLDRIHACDVALVGIGSWSPRASRFTEVLPGAEVEAAASHGVQADICSRLIDAAGQEVLGDLSARTIAATLDDLRAIPITIGVASGARKAAAVLAALRAAVLDVLVIDGELAEAVLRLDERTAAGRRRTTGTESSDATAPAMPRDTRSRSRSPQ